MQLAVNQPDLSQMFGQDSLFNTLYGMQRNDQANANDAQNYGQAQQDQSFQAQDQPIKLQQLGADVAHTQAMTDNANAQTPGIAATSTIQSNNAAADSSVPGNIRNNVALTKYLSNATASDLQQHADQSMIDLYSPDPQKRAAAQQVQMQMPAVQARLAEIKAQGANEYAVTQLSNTSREKIDANDVTNGKYGRNTANYLIQKGLTEGYPQQAGSWTAMAMNADQDGRSDLAMQYRQLASAATAASHDDKAAGAYTALAGKLNVAGLIGGSNVVNPTNVAPTTPAPVTPQALTQPQASPIQSPMVRVQDSQGGVHMVPRASIKNMPSSMKVLDQ